MKRVADFLTNHCYIIFAIFLIFTIICGFLATKVKINKDLYSYMPADSETSLGLEIMNDEFDYDKTSDYQMMLKDVPTDEKYQIKETIEKIDGVSSVDYDESDSYNRDNYTLYKIHVDAPADSETAERVYNTIHAQYSEQYETAEAGKVYDFNGAVIKFSVVVLAVACAMVILIIMSKSWVEPFLFLFAILLAVVMNKGTNIIFPSVSHITDSISAVLQMALSMDYAIMLSTRYRQEKSAADHPDKKTAMRRAMRYSFSAITSSSITTVVGLIVLIFMSFTIGRDMGLVLSKGVALSLVSIFTSLPAMLLIFDKAIDKTAKKTINFKMAWLGNFSYKIRRIAFPAFLIIFVGSFLLKGNTVIDFTSSQNNKIKDVFDQPNQIALVYNADMDADVTKLCYEYDAREDTARVLCYGNTINEPEKYNEVVPKINDLSSETPIDTEDYLIKAIYYHYYRNVNAHTIKLDDFVNFLQTEVFPNPNFADDISNETIDKVDLLSNFTDQVKVNQPRTKADIASILDIDASKLDDLYVLYLAEHDSGTALTLYDFANFVVSEVLTNPEYSAMISSSQRADLVKLLTFSNSTITDTPKSATELSALFGIDASTIERIFTYYNYTTTDVPTAEATIDTLIDFALNDENIIAESGLTPEEITNLKSLVTSIREIIADLEIKFPELKEFLSKEYSYSDAKAVVNKINEYIDNPEIKLDLATALEKLKNIFTLYQAETTALTTKLSPRTLVDFLIAHASDVKLSGSLTPETLTKLQLAQYIMDNQSTKFTATALAQAFSLDTTKIRLVYALYTYRHINPNPLLSLKTLINFIETKILPNPEYASRLTTDQQTKLTAVASLMHAAENGVPYNYETLYRAILPLSDDLDKNLLFLAYLYHGSLYDYDENWTLTLETLINFLVDKVLPDSRFSGRIDDEMRTKILNGQTTINDAKKLLVSPQHYRALIETNLPIESPETLSFIGDLKSKLGPNYKTDYFVLGDSAMAYEMSQTFSSEMDFITILTMLSIFAVVVCTFKSIFVSLLLVLVIQCAVYIVMAALSLTGSHVYFIALIIVQAILMGATIDYAILFTSYYVEHRTQHQLDKKSALIATYNKSISTILTSASILIIVTAIVGNLGTAIAGTICRAISFGTLCATIIILFLLPALLATLDRFIIKSPKSKSHPLTKLL